MTVTPRWPRFLPVILLALGASLLTLAAIAFLAVNDDWVVVALPLWPWPAPAPAFEARLFAVILAAFGAGVALVAGLGAWSWRRGQARDREELASLRAEITGLNRTIETLRHTARWTDPPDEERDP